MKSAKLTNGTQELLLRNSSSLPATVDVLVVDDSPLMQRIIEKLLQSDPQVRVIGTAANGVEAIASVKDLHPDVITLDVEMPVMNGLEALEIIMERYPTPVIMLSGLIDAEIVIQSLQHGAVDFVAKPSGTVSIDLYKIRDELLAKIKLATLINLDTVKATDTQSQRSLNSFELTKPHTDSGVYYVAIGASTGGPTAVSKILHTLPPGLPIAVFIVQHMPQGFTAAFAERLNKISALRVREARNNESVQIGTVYLAPSGVHMVVRHTAQGDSIQLLDFAPVNSVRPSIDVLMNSIVEARGKDTLGILLTGMGKDGAEGLAAIKEAGGYTFAQDRMTSVVFGMPNAAIQRGVVDEVLDISDIPGALVRVLLEKSHGG
ncbi:MAG: chemotaxis response regulator protein-glutamate methylesterase [Anaerolineales bacterium]|nr:MAG: chemotaxis response regulator protein-glutamate methylesterase [Anaerolineales bacterium]